MEVVDLLLDSGANPNAPSKLHETALLSTIKTNNVEPARRLLSLGAETDSEIHLDGICGQIIHHAASGKELESLQVFLDHGTDVTAECDLCPNTLMAAVNSENMLSYTTSRRPRVLT